ncbi:MAG TPA: DUF3825 domain-containing protein [Symbiobacteriaceae bacterium]|nr:DUF3825 domain-containing protein [Symbiobacteriaceae bacterium]
MNIESFTFCPPGQLEKALRFLAGQTGEAIEGLHARVDTALAAAMAAGELLFYKDEQPVTEEADADCVRFRTGLATLSGAGIVAKCDRNKRPGFQKWFGLIFEVAPRADDGFVLGDLYFPNWMDGPRFLERIAEDMAIAESWTYQNFTSRLKHPILRSYLTKTYERVKQQQRLLRKENHVLFNTGLIDKRFKEIYILCEDSPDQPGRLINAHAVLEHDRTVIELFGSKKPALADYFTSLADVIFNPDLEITTDDEHIIDDNWDRIPDEYKHMTKEQVFGLFQWAILCARIMARRNYKLAVPQFYGGKIQFLLPIYLSGKYSGTPDCALALEAVNGQCYRGNTILTLDMAYQNARLIARPDPTWLNPEAIAPAASPSA